MLPNPINTNCFSGAGSRGGFWFGGGGGKRIVRIAVTVWRKKVKMAVGMLTMKVKMRVKTVIKIRFEAMFHWLDFNECVDERDSAIYNTRWKGWFQMRLNWFRMVFHRWISLYQQLKTSIRVLVDYDVSAVDFKVQTVICALRRCEFFSIFYLLFFM